MVTLRRSTPHDMPRILEIWRRAVDATHHFLSPPDRRAIEAELCVAFPQLEMTLAVDATDRPIAFMILDQGKMEALFVDPDHHGQGVGTALVRSAIADHPDLTTDVNEQNAAAYDFYKHMGFEQEGRSPCDAQGRAYPLLHLRYRGASARPV